MSAKGDLVERIEAWATKRALVVVAVNFDLEMTVVRTPVQAWATYHVYFGDGLPDRIEL